MKGNIKSRRKEAKGAGDRGEIGIGTMIVFIAAVIVAAIAAAVLINTAGNLERQASQTGDETTDEVSGNMFVHDALGHVDDTSTGMDSVNFTVSLAPGASPLDLETMTVRWQSGSTQNDLSFAESGARDSAPATCNNSGLSAGFCVVDVIQADGGSDYSVLSSGDRVKILIDLTGNELDNREDVDIRFMPETGTPVTDGFTTPASWNGDKWHSLS